MTFDEMNDHELEDWINKHLGWGADWSLLLIFPTIHRTRDVLLKMQGSLTRQLGKYNTPDNQAWVTKATSLLGMVTQRLAQVERRFEKNMDSTSAWKQFAHELVALIVDHGSDELIDMLEQVYIPVGGLNAGDWYDRRVAKREAMVAA